MEFEDEADNSVRPPQFRLSQAAVVVTAIAIVLAISAPWFRSFNSAQWLALLRFTICMFGGAILYQAVVGQLYRKSLRRAGRLLIVIDHQPTKRLHFWKKLFCLVMFIAPIGQVLFNIHLLGAQDSPTPMSLAWLDFFVPLSMTYQILLMLGQPTAIRFYENGLLTGWTLAEWKNFKTCRWSTVVPNQLMINCGTGMLLAIPVDPDQREQVEAILQANVPQLQA